MAYTLQQTGALLQKIINESEHTPIQDVVGDNYTSGSPLAITANTEYTFTCNGNTRNFKSFPSHITNFWNTVTNIGSFSELVDTKMIVATPKFVFSPSTASAGKITVRVYVNDTVPKVLDAKIVDYKAVASKVSQLLTFYTGTEAGYDVKNDGVFFTVEADQNGDLYDTSIIIYRT